ncbi:hypothetical protein [Novosphingobium sp. BL-52-GroH]|uniref:hypothetical protein n=1 Tax=Novosphingobium sp. BL-52-GroH TaxID=3349877 RepID=UPI00384DAD35
MNSDGPRFSPDTPLGLAKLSTTYKIGDLTVGGTRQSRIYRAMPVPTGAFRHNGQPAMATGHVSQGSYVLIDLLVRPEPSPNVGARVDATDILIQPVLP